MSTVRLGFGDFSTLYRGAPDTAYLVDYGISVHLPHPHSVKLDTAAEA